VTEPLISCLCLTVPGRAKLLLDAVQCFTRQTYPNRELLIVCDPGHAIETAAIVKPHDGLRARIAVIPTELKLLIGSKRNVGCAYATGEYIAVWDDDDYSGPLRLQHQLAALQASDKAVTTYRRMPFFFEETGAWWLSPYGATPTTSNLGVGSSLFFRRDWWQDHKFTHRQISEDMLFCRTAANAQQLLILEECGRMFARRHADNTWKLKMPAEGWEKIAMPAWIGAYPVIQDQTFYPGSYVSPGPSSKEDHAS
jgi:glycosyltransferase involved in cell wall biosynthesis